MCFNLLGSWKYVCSANLINNRTEEKISMIQGATSGLIAHIGLLFLLAPHSCGQLPHQLTTTIVLPSLNRRLPTRPHLLDPSLTKIATDKALDLPVLSFPCKFFRMPCITMSFSPAVCYRGLGPGNEGKNRGRRVEGKRTGCPGTRPGTSRVHGNQ